MHKCSNEIIKMYRDMGDSGKTRITALFLANCETWDDETKEIANKTAKSALSYNFIPNDEDVIKILKKYGKYNGKMKCKKFHGMAEYEFHWKPTYGIQSKKLKCETCDAHKTNNHQETLL